VFDRRIGISLYPEAAQTIPPTVVERRFVYDRDHIIFSFDGSSIARRYLYGPALDMVLADERNGNILWTLTDNLGTVRDLVNSSGVVQNYIKYDSFGNITSQTNAGITTRFGYTGREWDAWIGLYFYRSRYYDPTVGRFISEDRISFAGGDVNLYRYVKNSPANYTDPFGYFVPPAPKPPLPWILIPLIPLIDLFFPEPFGDPEWSDPIPVKPRKKCPPCPPPKSPPRNSSPNNSPTPTPVPSPTPKRSPAPKIPPPGICTQTQHDLLQAEVKAACSGNPKRSCKDERVKDCNILRRNQEKARACLEARKRINETCYLGGDEDHQQQIKQEQIGLEKCDLALKRNGCVN
jgi:RHS repeat-associated protein